MMTQNAWAEQVTKSFLLTVKNDTVSVVRPTEYERFLDVSVKNESDGRLFAEIIADKDVVSRFSLEAGKALSVNVDTKGHEHLLFVCKSPAMQAVELYIKDVKK